MNSSRTFKSKRHKIFYFSRILFIEGSLLRNVRKLVTFFKIRVNRQKKKQGLFVQEPFLAEKKSAQNNAKKKRRKSRILMASQNCN